MTGFCNNNWRASQASETLSGVYKFKLVWYICIYIYILEKKTFKNVKKFRVALKSTETRKYQPCPLHIGWALSKSYGDLFYTPKSLPYFQLLTKFR